MLEVQLSLYAGRRETDLEKCLGAKNWTVEALAGNMEAAEGLFLVAILPNLRKVRLADRFQDTVDSHFLSILKDLLLDGLDLAATLT